MAQAHHFSRDGVRLERMIRDDSHFIVSVQRCGLCSQAFVSVFTEYIDWVASQDAQYRTVLPITDAEADDLVAGRLSPHRVGALGDGRRHLQSDWPSGAEEPSVYWGSGVFGVRVGY
ncbi:hypothetical protein F7Q99_28745 [Streptomyces kaniharaensis]|uniref:Uncharacterized protein n=1 Tax=Streptomyces kaniharaensis TaxID=212423 RepID=A0A6N7L0C9_9ACTN|nr:hypothetical protein [Streptomyces kaniharaensis]MQS16117.1 hypothetical protein [Streptomyces kaniharaensis]